MKPQYLITKYYEILLPRNLDAITERLWPPSLGTLTAPRNFAFHHGKGRSFLSLGPQTQPRDFTAVTRAYSLPPQTFPQIKEISL